MGGDEGSGGGMVGLRVGLGMGVGPGVGHDFVWELVGTEKVGIPMATIAPRAAIINRIESIFIISKYFSSITYTVPRNYCWYLIAPGLTVTLVP